MIRAVEPVSDPSDPCDQFDRPGTVPVRGRAQVAALPAVCLLVLAGGGIGCSDQEEIRSYIVPKPRFETRLLAAMTSRDGSTWFFKMIGRTRFLEEHADVFSEFLKSVHFDENSTPVWKLPDGWKQELGKGMRFATIRIHPKGKAPVMVTVISFPDAGGTHEERRLSNINRWRRQVELDPVTPEDLDSITETVRLADGSEALLVDFTGTRLQGASSSPPSSPPFAGAPFASSGRRLPGASGSSRGAPRTVPFSYDVPAGWQQAANDALSAAAYSLEEGDLKARFTMTSIAAVGADVGLNVNRWRRQIGLAEATNAEIDGQLRRSTVDSMRVTRVEIVGPAEMNPRQAILAAIAVRDSVAWFFKLRGDAELVLREKANFDALVESVRFRTAGGEANGD